MAALANRRTSRFTKVGGLLGFSVRVPASQIISVKQARKSSSVKLIRQLLVWRKSVMVFIMNTVIFLSRLPIIIIIRHF